MIVRNIFIASALQFMMMCCYVLCIASVNYVCSSCTLQYTYQYFSKKITFEPINYSHVLLYRGVVAGVSILSPILRVRPAKSTSHLFLSPTYHQFLAPTFHSLQHPIYIVLSLVVYFLICNKLLLQPMNMKSESASGF